MSPCAHVTAPLFVPASRPERFAKAAASAADAVILDLEDAVPPADKDAARSALTAAFTDKPVIVRINARGTPWHADDLAAIEALPIAAVMVPKVETAEDVRALGTRHSVIALVETVRGVAAARAIAGEGRPLRIAFGSVDYAADLGCAHERIALAAARAEILIASRLGDLPRPLDGVTTGIADLDAVLSDALHARTLGFGGKMCIHPAQLLPVLEGFRPSAAELDWAERVLASGDGAVMVDGAMIDAPVRARARAMLDRVGLV